MFNKFFLLHKILKILEENEFETFVTRCCFDIAAKREKTLLIKTIFNVDALEEAHALSLKALSYFLSAYSLIVSVKNNRGKLDDKIIYSRFGLPVMTTKLFEEFIERDEILAAYSAKGRHTVRINTFLLRKKRKELGLSLSRLSSLIGISKKALYEVENRRVLPSSETVEKLEEILSVRLRLPYKIESSTYVKIKPKDEFQKRVCKELTRIGIRHSVVHTTPFELVGKEGFKLITKLSSNLCEVEKKLNKIKEFSEFFSTKSFIVAKTLFRKNMEGVPLISEEELREIYSSKELNKLIEERLYQ